MLIGILFCQSCNSPKEKADKDVQKIDEEAPIEIESKATKASNEFVEGKALYLEHCMICHQMDGSGVSGLNPPLIDTEYVGGDKDRLLGILLNGSNVGLNVNGSTYSNAMPSFRALSDADIAHISSYIRNSFGNKAEPVTEEEVASYRLANENE